MRIKKGKWGPNHGAVLVSLHGKGLGDKQLCEALGVSEPFLQLRMKELGLRSNNG